MQKSIIVLLIALIAVFAFTPAALAGDRGPQKQVTAVTTNSATASVALPIGDTGRFDPAWLVFAGNFGGTTQTVSYVSGTYTGTVNAAVSATGAIAATNIPTMFSGDKFLMTTTGLTTNTVNVTVIGRVFD